MIVQCEQCQTRFKIPDEKVTEKGVKVRCTKCQNTFRVAREPAPALSAPPPAAPPAGQADPFQAFGEAPEPTGEVTRPGAAYYAPGAPTVKSQMKTWGDVDVDIDVDAPPAAPGAGGAMMPFDPPSPSPGVASRRQAAPPAPLPSPTNLTGLDLEDPFADFMADAPAPSAAPPPPVAAPRPAPPGAFAPPGARTAPPGAFAPGPAGAARPAAVASSGPGAFSPEAAPLGGPPSAVAARGPVPPGMTAPPAPGAVEAAPAHAAFPAGGAAPARAATPPASQLAGAGAVPARAAMPPAAAPPAGAGAAPARAAMPPGAAAPARVTPPPGPVGASRPGGPPVASPGPAAAGSLDPAPDPLFDFPIDTPAAPDAASLRHAADVAAEPAPSGAAALGPVAPAPGFESDDPFASIDMAAAPPQDLSAAPEDLGAGPEPMGDLFDFSGAGASGEEGMVASDTGRAALLGDVPSDAGVEEPGGISLLSDVPAYDDGDPFKITTPRREVVELAHMRTGPAVTVAKPSARIEDVGMPQRRMPGRARKLTGLVLNVTIAAALVVALGALGTVYLRDGKVDPSTLSPDRLRALVLPAPRPFVASDVTNGLYETRDGRMLYVVRGEAENRTGAAAAVRVRAALFDGDQRVRSTEGLAGALATPEELHAVTTREAATALRQRMDAASLPVPPSGKVPFLLLFQEFPADLDGYRLEVTLEPIPTEPTADRTGG
ncbi:zinc-ribbon domain-containing protein [Corallococcus sp. RDP092CA]